MGPENRLNRITRLIPEIPRKRHVDKLVDLFETDFSDLDVSIARHTLFANLGELELPYRDIRHIRNVAALAYWLHKDEKRFTKEPYITHPLEVAITLTENPYIDPHDMTDHIIMALGHDLRENTFISRFRLQGLAKKHSAGGIELLSKKSKAEGGQPLTKGEYFDRLLKYGDKPIWRVKIADWIHNLATTPKSTDGYDEVAQKKIIKFQAKFQDTAKYILPLIRLFPEGEREYQYDLLERTFLTSKPDTVPDLPPLLAA